jgi:hypothetical protein
MASVETQMDAFEVMRRGTPMTRNGNTWTHCDFRMYTLSEDHQEIIWSKKSTMSDERIPIRSIRSIMEGQTTESFQKDPKKPVDHLSWSIIWTDAEGQEQCYDLICCRAADRECWVKGLRQLSNCGSQTDCVITVPEAKVDTALACILARTRSQQAGRMAWAIPMAVIPILGIGWLGYTTYYRNQTEKDIVHYRLPEIKKLIAYIKALIDGETLAGHPFVERDAKQRMEFIGQCYEAAVNVKDTVLKATLDAQMHNTAVAVAESQALYTKLLVLEADALKGRGWFDGATRAVTGLASGMASMVGLGSKDAEPVNEPTLGETGKTERDLPEIKFDL